MKKQYSLEEIINLLENEGYDIYHENGEHNLLKISDSAMEQNFYTHWKNHNETTEILFFTKIDK